MPVTFVSSHLNRRIDRVSTQQPDYKSERKKPVAMNINKQQSVEQMANGYYKLKWYFKILKFIVLSALNRTPSKSLAYSWLYCISSVKLVLPWAWIVKRTNRYQATREGGETNDNEIQTKAADL